MNKTQWQCRQDTIACFISEAQVAGSMLSVEDIENIIDKLHGYEVSLHHIAEHQCNDDMNDAIRKNVEHRETRIKSRVVDFAGLLRFTVKFNGDPRGGAIRFILPSGRSNGWDGETWGIYW